MKKKGDPLPSALLPHEDISVYSRPEAHRF